MVLRMERKFLFCRCPLRGAYLSVRPARSVHHSPQVFFSIHHYNLVRSVSGPPKKGPGNLSDLQAGFERVLRTGLANLTVDEETLDVFRPGSPAEQLAQLKPDDPRAIEFRECMRAWYALTPACARFPTNHTPSRFRRTTWSSIRKQDFYVYLYWVFYNSTLPALHLLPDHRRKVLDNAIKQIEHRAGMTISDNPSSGASPMLLTVDRLNVTSRPFVLYAVVFAANWMFRRWLERAHGIRFGCYEGLE